METSVSCPQKSHNTTSSVCISFVILQIKCKACAIAPVVALTSQKEYRVCFLSSSEEWTQCDAIIRLDLKSCYSWTPTSKKVPPVECKKWSPTWSNSHLNSCPMSYSICYWERGRRHVFWHFIFLTHSFFQWNVPIRHSRNGMNATLRHVTTGKMCVGS